MAKMKTKTSKLQYSKLEMQQYMSEFNSVEAKTLLKYRLRMSHYSGNFKGDSPIQLCPLCGRHDDEQQLSFQCPVVMSSIDNDAEYDDLFKSRVSKLVLEKLIDIDKLRADC